MAICLLRGTKYDIFSLLFNQYSFYKYSYYLKELWMFSKLSHFSSKGIRFSGDTIKNCVSFIDLVDSTKNTITMEGLENIRKYYSTFINSVSDLVKSSSGRIIKKIGDCLLFYFPKTSDINDANSFQNGIECCFKILDERYKINNELARQHLPPFNYRISMDYGVLDLALVGDYSQIDLFGSTVNLCSKINNSLSISNQLIIGDKFYRILKSFSSIMDNYNFINNGEYKLADTNRYSTYNIRKTDNNCDISITNNNKNVFLTKKQLDIFKENEKRFFFHKKNDVKRIILVDDEQDLLFTYRMFLRDYDYNNTSFTDPSIAFNYIRDISDFDNLLVILDIRMKNVNGLQLHQQIKAIDPTIKVIFITALDIVDELLSIVPNISKGQIMRKPVNKQEFTNTVNELLN
jgi:CheY-like chemotaxis protein